MYKKLYEQPNLELLLYESDDVIVMSGIGTAYDDGNDNVVGGALNIGGLG